MFSMFEGTVATKKADVQIQKKLVWLILAQKIDLNGRLSFAGKRKRFE